MARGRRRKKNSNLNSVELCLSNQADFFKWSLVDLKARTFKVKAPWPIRPDGLSEEELLRINRAIVSEFSGALAVALSRKYKNVLVGYMQNVRLGREVSRVKRLLCQRTEPIPMTLRGLSLRQDACRVT